jgi:hypothetical protein
MEFVPLSKHKGSFACSICDPKQIWYKKLKVFQKVIYVGSKKYLDVKFQRMAPKFGTKQWRKVKRKHYHWVNLG